MRTLVLADPELRLGVEAGRYCVLKGDRILRHVRPDEVEDVLLIGGAMPTSAALFQLLREGKDVVFLTKDGRYRGRLVGRPSRSADLRLAQLRHLASPPNTLALARAQVHGKLTNQRHFLLRLQRRLRDEELAGGIAQLRGLMRRVAEAPDLDALRGLEGRAAAVYFSLLGRALRPPAFRFTTRTRRPPRDPVNAALSFGYTLLTLRMESLVLRVGLDPYLGALHAADHGQPALVLDMVEPFRPLLVDSLVVALINRRELEPQDFRRVDLEEAAEKAWLDDGAETQGGPIVYLNENGRTILLRAFHRRLRETVVYPPEGRALPYQQIMLRQVYALARLFRGEADSYEPFLPR